MQLHEDEDPDEQRLRHAGGTIISFEILNSLRIRNITGSKISEEKFVLVRLALSHFKL
jgi:hypothetical protein